MPPNSATLRVGPYFLSLLLMLLVLFGLVFLPGQRHTPKLGLDLEGGAQVTLQAQTPNGKTPNQAAMKVARQILENRVNAKGVSAAQVYQQGSNQIVIAVPNTDSQGVAKVGQAAKLNFRSVLFAAVPNTAATPGTPTPSGATASGSGSATPSGANPTTAPKISSTTGATTSASPNRLLDANRLAPSTSKSAVNATKTTPAATAAKTTAAAPTTPTPAATTAKVVANPFTQLGFPLPKTNAAYDALPPTQQALLKAALANFDCTAKPADVADQPLAACNTPVGNAAPTYKYLLSEVIVAGTEISSADAVAPSANGDPSWTVSINLKSKGQTAWANFTRQHHSTTQTGSAISCSATTTPCADYVAFTLDGAVITVPQTNGTINGTTQVSGTFTESYAKDLANDLKYGALPLNFTQLTKSDVSPTLGSSQLKAGLLAGGIGLLLVVIYSFLYYRGLGFVTVFSLLVSGGLTYAMLVVLGREIGFTLTLAGIAGFIVAVGITADSFVVLFERLKDEVHSGRSLRVAVPRAWTRARRTILSADTVSFIAAAVLYYFTVGDVRGFAFTLGLSTLLDLVVVFLFTHPLVSLLSRSKAFGSPRFTGLDSVRTGGIAPSPEGPARSAKARRTHTAGGASPAGSVALLEREDETDDRDPDDLDFDVDDLDHDDLDHDDDAVAPVAATPDATREQDLDARAPRRSRVVPRPAPAAEIGADAAERAAARRGRTVRPPKPVVEEPAEDDTEPDTDDLDDVTEVTDPVESVDADTVTADTDTALTDTESVPAPSPAADPAPAPEPIKAAAVPAAGTAAERAAARRRRPRGGATAVAQPQLPVTPAPDEPEPTDTSEATEALGSVSPDTASGRPGATGSGSTDTDSPETLEASNTATDRIDIEPDPQVEVETSPVIDDAPARSTTAAERAAARRARIRSRTAANPDTDGEDA